MCFGRDSNLETISLFNSVELQQAKRSGFKNNYKKIRFGVPSPRLERGTNSLKGYCSTIELRGHTKPYFQHCSAIVRRGRISLWLKLPGHTYARFFITYNPSSFSFFSNSFCSLDNFFGVFIFNSMYRFPFPYPEKCGIPFPEILKTFPDSVPAGICNKIFVPSKDLIFILSPRDEIEKKTF